MPPGHGKKRNQPGLVPVSGQYPVGLLHFLLCQGIIGTQHQVGSKNFFQVVIHVAVQGLPERLDSDKPGQSQGQVQNKKQ